MEYLIKAVKTQEIPFQTLEEAEKAKLMLYDEGYRDVQIIECESIESITENCCMPTVISYTEVAK